MQGFSRRIAAGFSATIVAVALAACGGFDKEAAEKEILDVIKAPPNAIADADSIDCPGLSDETGSEFTCTVTTEGGEEYEASGTVTEDNYVVDSVTPMGGVSGASGAQ